MPDKGQPPRTPIIRRSSKSVQRPTMPKSSKPTLWAGASGYAYDLWKGSFYPEKIAADAMLAWYAPSSSSCRRS